MRKFVITISVTTCILLGFITSNVSAQTKIDSFINTSTKSNRFTSSKALSLSSGMHSNVNNITSDVFVKSSETMWTKDRIRELGGRVYTVAGNIITANIPTDSIELLANDDEVQFIEAAKPIGLSNDVASNETNSLEVHEGMNLPEGYSGKNTIIGIIDTGIDYTHPDFADGEGRSRIVSIWNQTRVGGPSPDEIEDSYGTECKSGSIADGSCPLVDSDGHGTHVAGTAAGSSEAYTGVAPDANIIVVSYDSSVNLQSGYADTIFSTKICQAAFYIFQKAGEMGMPAVVNLSLGTHIGPHDGTSLFEQCLSGLLEGSAGRAIVAAAGNEFSTEEKFTGIHAGYSVSGTNASNFVIRKISNDRIYYIDFWGSEGSDISVGLAIHDGEPNGNPKKYSGQIEPGDSSEGSFLGEAVEYSINYSEVDSAINGKPHAGIRIKLDGSMGEISNYSFDLVVSGSGSFDAWLFPDKPSKTVQFTNFSGAGNSGWTYVPGDSKNSIAIPATSPDIIAVGAYTTRTEWDRGSGCCAIPIFELGELLPFSSSGPTAAPDMTGVKPDIAAPGGMIASTLSSQSNQNDLMIMDDGRHVLQAGTSMAAPMVSGTVALMFSADPNYTYSDVKRYVIESAYVDESVGTAPNGRWGHGKLDVLAAVETAVNGGASGHFDGNSSLNNPEDSPSGKSGCQLIMTTNTASESTPILMMMLIMVAVSIAGLAIGRITRKKINKTDKLHK